MPSGERVGIDHLLCVTLLNEIRQSPNGSLRWQENSEVRIQEVRVQSGETFGNAQTDPTPTHTDTATSTDTNF
jgi:hypothetical protein